jgi:hypothetical protein
VFQRLSLLDNSPSGLWSRGFNATIGGRRGACVDGGLGNVVAGNTGYGLIVNGARSTIQGNIVGLDADGVSMRPNGASGLLFTGEHTLMGGLQPDVGNVISGNTQHGVIGNGSHAIVQGNIFGLDVTGTVACPNTVDGLHVLADFAWVGGIVEEARNIASGNKQWSCSRQLCGPGHNGNAKPWQRLRWDRCVRRRRTCRW